MSVGPASEGYCNIHRLHREPCSLCVAPPPPDSPRPAKPSEGTQLARHWFQDLARTKPSDAEYARTILARDVDSLLQRTRQDEREKAAKDGAREALEAVEHCTHQACSCVSDALQALRGGKP